MSRRTSTRPQHRITITDRSGARGVLRTAFRATTALVVLAASLQGAGAAAVVQVYYPTGNGVVYGRPDPETAKNDAHDAAQSNLERSCNHYANNAQYANLSNVHPISSSSGGDASSGYSATVILSGTCTVSTQ